MRFSIITICYNEEKRIRGTLESVYSQSFRDFEHIIEDGSSTDNTLEVVQEHAAYYNKGQLKVFSEPDDGLYDAMNRALRRATGEYLCFMNSGDELFDHNTLKKVNEEIEKTKYKDIYHGIPIIVFQNMDGLRQSFCDLESDNQSGIDRFLRTGLTGLIHQAIFANKKCFINNTFDTHYKLRAELKWYYMCFKNGYSIKKMDFPVCKYSFGGQSEKSTSIKRSQEETREILKEFRYSTELYETAIKNSVNNCIKDSNIYNQWLALLQAGHSMVEYFQKYQMRTIAIYGYAELANHLINELKYTDILIAYLIDRKKVYPYAGIPVIHPEDKLCEVDAIIVTAVMEYEEIKKYLEQRVICPIISLEEILNELWFIGKSMHSDV